MSPHFLNCRKVPKIFDRKEILNKKKTVTDAFEIVKVKHFDLEI